MFKYIKSFLGIVIFVLIVAINMTLIVGIVHLSVSISLGFLLGNFFMTVEQMKAILADQDF